MTTPNSPLSPSSPSASDDDDERSFDAARFSTAAAAAAPPAAAHSKDTPAISATRRHSLSSTSTSSFSSPHLPSHYTDTSISSASSTPNSTPSSSSTPGTSPFTQTHSLNLPPSNPSPDLTPFPKVQLPPAPRIPDASPTLPPIPTSSPASSTFPLPASSSSAASMTSDAAVFANSQTLAKAVLAGQSSIVGSSKMSAMGSFSNFSPSSLSQLSSSLSLPGYANRPALPAPLSSLPPLALSFSSHPSSALTPSAAAAAAAASVTNSSLSSLTSAFQSSLIKGAAAAAGALTLNQLMAGNGMITPGAPTSSPLPYAALGDVIAGSTPPLPMMSSPTLTSSTTPASYPTSSPLPSHSAASSPSLLSMQTSASYSSQPSFPSPPSSSMSSLSSLSPFTRLPPPSPQPALPSMYSNASMGVTSMPLPPHPVPMTPTRPHYILPSPTSPSTSSSPAPSTLSSSPNIPPLSSVPPPPPPSLQSLAWPTTYKSPSSVLNRYLIHFPHDTAHGAQAGLYQPGKPSQLIIRLHDPDAPPPSPTKGDTEASVIRIPCKVALKPTVKRTAKLRTLHEISMHPAWYDCESKDLGEEEKRWETGSKQKRPKYLLLRQDTKSMIHVIHVNKWNAEEALEEDRAMATLNAASSSPGRGENGGGKGSSSKGSSSISGLLHSLAAAGGMVSAGAAGLGPTIPLSPLHLLPVSEDSMAHVQTKGRGKTEERRKETAQLYLSLKVDKWYELRCHGGWKIVDMEMKHHKGGHQISNVTIPFHHLPVDAVIDKTVQAITALTGKGPGNGSSSAGTATSKGKSSSGKGTKGESSSSSKPSPNGESLSGDGEEGGASERKGKPTQVKQEPGEGGSRGNGRSSSHKRKQSPKPKLSVLNDDGRERDEQAKAANQQYNRAMLEQLLHQGLYSVSSPVYVQQMQTFPQLSPSSPGTASSIYPQLPSVPSTLPLSISAFDPAILLHPTTPNSTGGMSPSNLYTLPTDPQSYSTLLSKAQQQQQPLPFFVSSNSAFKTRKSDTKSDDGEGAERGSGEKRRKVDSGDGEESKGEGGQDDSGSTLSGNSANDELMGGSSSSSSTASASATAKPPREVSALDSRLDSLYMDNFLRAESAASITSLLGSGTTISLHPFGASNLQQQNLLPPPASSFSAALSKPGHPTPIKIPTASRLSPSLSPLLPQMGMTLSPSPGLVPLGSYTLSPPPSTPNLMESDPLFALNSANIDGAAVRRG